MSEKRYQEVKKCTIKGRKVPKILLKFKTTKINWKFYKRVTDDVAGLRIFEISNMIGSKSTYRHKSDTQPLLGDRQELEL